MGWETAAIWRDRVRMAMTPKTSPTSIAPAPRMAISVKALRAESPASFASAAPPLLLSVVISAMRRNASRARGRNSRSMKAAASALALRRDNSSSRATPAS